MFLNSKNTVLPHTMILCHSLSNSCSLFAIISNICLCAKCKKNNQPPFLILMTGKNHRNVNNPKNIVKAVPTIAKTIPNTNFLFSIVPSLKMFSINAL